MLLLLLLLQKNDKLIRLIIIHISPILQLDPLPSLTVVKLFDIARVQRVLIESNVVSVGNLIQVGFL